MAEAEKRVVRRSGAVEAPAPAPRWLRREFVQPAVEEKFTRVEEVMRKRGGGDGRLVPGSTGVGV